MGNPVNGGRIIEIPYVAADVETTGLSAADGHPVCEFALLRFLRGAVIDSFVSLVNPLRPIDPGAS
ncbi:MAG: exonuclease domain-containing protein, partial [Candidatus Deferrimicrobium sp.]